MRETKSPERQLIRLKLFGGFEAIGSDGREIILPTRKARLLLAYLASPPGQLHSRDRLVGLLWGDRGEEQARGSLRNALSVIRKGFGTEAIVTDGNFVSLAPGAISIDVSDFELCLTERTPRTLQAAADLYRGDFLEGVSAVETPFQEWLMVEETRLRDLALGALFELLDLQAATADYVEAIATARRALLIDPVREDVHRMLMRLYAAAGQRGLALRQFELCRDELAARLGVSPEDETNELLERIRKSPSDALRREFAGDAVETAEPEPPSEAPAPPAAPEPGPEPKRSEKPSVAVLPFKNVGGDPSEAFLADGLAEDITAGLSRFRWFFVIARGSTLAYKDRPIEPKEVAGELGVRYLVTGSVRRAGDRIRVAADLIDAKHGTTVWADRYDGVVDDIFEFQDRIAGRIVAALEPEISDAELRRARRKPQGLDSWSCFQQGLGHSHAFSPEGLAEARRLFKMATELDPTFATAFAELGYADVLAVLLDCVPDPDAVLGEAKWAARRAVALDPRDAVGHFTLGRVCLVEHDYDMAIDEMERALDCNPSAARAHFGRGCALVYTGRPAEAIPSIEQAIRLSPRDPNLWGFQIMMSRAYFNMGQYETALDWARRAMKHPNAHFWPLVHAAAALGHLGRCEEGARLLSQVAAVRPDFSAEVIRRTVGRYGTHSHVEDIIEGLRHAGMAG
jgi:TolB-like protein/DNA-binding SARP family transcriptional activator